MRDKLKKLALVFMALCLLTSVAAPAQVKAADEVALEETKLTLMVGDFAGVGLNNITEDDADSITWSSSNEAVATVVDVWFWEDSAACQIHAKKKGTAKITAQYKNKKYTCTVKVKKFALSNTEGKNKKDVKALKEIIKKQNLKGAWLPTDLDSDFTDGSYCWDEKGNLVGISWIGRQIQGSLSLKEFESLEFLWVMVNSELRSLDVSKNTALTELYCFDNQLSSLDVSRNTALTMLSCGDNQLRSLDLSKNTALTMLSCGDNQLSSLDVSRNTALTMLSCGDNQLRSLDLSKNKALTDLWCDDNVKVTGYSGNR